MRNPKTIKGYISLIKAIEKIQMQTLKGYDNLPEVTKENIRFLGCEISNIINEVKDEGRSN